MLKIAYVGFGKSTNRYHLPYIQQRLDKFDVTRIYAPTLGKRPLDQAALEASGTRFTSDFTDILNDDALDLVVVVTPAPTHYQLVKQLLLAGQNVLVDKPMVTTIAELDDLLQIAKAQHCFLMPFQNRRFDSDYLTLQHVLQAGYVGRPVELELHMDHYRPTAGQLTGEQIDGTWYGHGVHLVDQIVGLFGRPEAATYDLRATRLTQATIEDQFEVNLHYANAFKATVQSTELAVTPYPKWRLVGTQGTFIKTTVDQQENDLKAGIMPGMAGFGLDAPQAYGHVTYYNQSGDRIEKDLPSIQGDYGRVYDNVYDVLVNGQTQLVTDEQMQTTIEILSRAFDEKGPHTEQLN
ncbi:Gfo/Idh/MocA family oxidoreductase [Weissella diestrammenae]|uniref:Gfo/Idh/MocA family oxidoreductase n=1 Tax=Weissella diestrammenae TaxID=1162633 RepID=A0A7G9T404_9LACO|nr:Gfo/Idh/MocA family oxidoreductase [Weissella diestrammenae]MCM0583026.1 Gfo/Idh/MocA family oxidoreductase [Weissella diestrammenae]QNN74829.1 Gfo/Idh/MocA family oxidoreductase [Weissella diestrammenae]